MKGNNIPIIKPRNIFPYLATSVAQATISIPFRIQETLACIVTEKHPTVPLASLNLAFARVAGKLLPLTLNPGHATAME